jgi:hypothetical protein
MKKVGFETMPKVTLPNHKNPYALVTALNKTESLAGIDSELIKNLYKTCGAILFRGYELNTKNFSDMAGRFCTHATMNDSPGREVIDKENNVQTVNLGVKPFALHPEMSRLPWKPDICWFGCLAPPKLYGQTTICDGVKVVKRMPPKLMNVFKERRLLYKDLCKGSRLRMWFSSDTPGDDQLNNPPEGCPYEFVREGGTIYSMFTAPALHKTMFSGELSWGNFLLFDRYTRHRNNLPVFENGSIVSDALVAAVKNITDKIEVAIKWKQGDLLMLDNTRFMHGRRKVVDVSERLILSSFGYLNFADTTHFEHQNALWRDPEIWKKRADQTR